MLVLLIKVHAQGAFDYDECNMKQVDEKGYFTCYYYIIIISNAIMFITLQSASDNCYGGGGDIFMMKIMIIIIECVDFDRYGDFSSMYVNFNQMFIFFISD